MRPIPALTACTATILAMVVPPNAATASPASATPPRVTVAANPVTVVGNPVNLIANPSFGADPSLSRWTCDGHVTVDTTLQPGVEFLQLGTRDDAVPPVGGLAAGPAQPHVGRGMFAPTDYVALFGAPTGQQRATCSQVVPVRPKSTYTLSADVYDGLAFLGSDYGAVQGRGSRDGDTLLSTTFTTGPHADRVRVYVQGALGDDGYVLDDVTLTGPDSRTRVPAVPSGLVSHRYTSRAVVLTWVGSPGATRYRVYRDGCLIATTSDAWWPVYGLTAGRTYEFAVEAVDSAGASRRVRLLTQSAPAAAQPPVPPSDILVDVDWAGTVSLGWAPQDDATDGHQVYLNGELAGWVVGNGAEIRNLPPGTYTVEATSLNPAGESARSPAVTITI